MPVGGPGTSILAQIAPVLVLSLASCAFCDTRAFLGHTDFVRHPNQLWPPQGGELCSWSNAQDCKPPKIGCNLANFGPISAKIEFPEAPIYASHCAQSARWQSAEHHCNLNLIKKGTKRIGN